MPYSFPSSVVNCTFYGAKLEYVYISQDLHITVNHCVIINKHMESHSF